MINRMVEYQRDLDAVFAAVADPTRRAILAALARKPATVTEIARPFPVSLNAISKHLMVLERAGLIRRRVVGREHHCSIEPKPLRNAAAWFDHYRMFWEERLDFQIGWCLSGQASTAAAWLAASTIAASNPSLCGTQLRGSTTTGCSGRSGWTFRSDGA